jgi:hypothetical protein
MGNLRIGPYFAFLSKFWVVGHVITRSRTASGYVEGADDLLRSGLGRRARGRTSELPYCVQLIQALGPTLSLSLRPRQWRTAHDKLSLDLFEKRFAVYEATKNFLITAINQGQVTGDDYRVLYNGLRGADQR